MQNPISEDVRNYCFRVWKHWWVIVFFVLLAVVGATQDILQSVWKDFVMPVWVWVLTVFIGFTIAQYMAWREMRDERNDERKEKEEIRKYDVLQETLHKLALHRDTLIAYQNREINNPTEFGVWKSEFTALRSEIRTILENEISPAECRLYDDIGVFPNYPMQRTGTFNDQEHLEYENWRSRSIRDHRWLTSLIIDYGRHKVRTETFLKLVQPDNETESE